MIQVFIETLIAIVGATEAEEWEGLFQYIPL